MIHKSGDKSQMGKKLDKRYQNEILSAFSHHINFLGKLA